MKILIQNRYYYLLIGGIVKYIYNYGGQNEKFKYTIYR